MQSIITTKFTYYTTLAVLALILFVAATYANTELVQKYQRQLYSDTQKQLSYYHNRLLTNLQSNIQIVRGLPGLFAINPKLEQAQFTKAVRQLIYNDSEIRNIAAAPDMVIRYMYPLEGNEEAMGLDYRQTPSQFAAADRARQTHELVLAGPLKLKQGGVGLITRIPVYLQNEKGEDYFWGLISAVIDVERFFAQSGLLEESMPIKLAIRGKDGLGEKGEVFHGDPALFDKPRLTQTLALPEGEWLLAAEPVGGWKQLPEDIWQKRFLIDGIALVIFLGLAVFIKTTFAASVANLKFRNLIESSPVPYMLQDKNGRVVFINRAFCQSYGYQLDELQSLVDWWQITEAPAQYRETFLSADAKPAEQVPVEIRMQSKQGQHKVVLLSASVLHETFDNQMLLVFYDITQRKASEEKLRFSSRVFNQAQEGIIITDTRGNITDVNPAFCEITGYEREEVIGHTPSLLNSGKHPAEFFNKMWQSISQHGYWQGEVWNRRKSGELYAELLTISALADDDGQSRHYVGLFSDITQSKKQQETLELMAHYDVLTKLPNRLLFADRFSQAVMHSNRTHTLLAVCFLDLDGFKPINDSCGHEVGDQLLIEVAQRLKASVRDEDTISRFGGDEFAILFRDIESQDECEQMLRRLHQSLARPYKVDGLTLKISASSGVTFYPTENVDLDTLLRHADQAMYQAKLAGRNTYKLFNPALNSQNQEKQQQLEEIRRGLAQQQFCLFYQPKVNMKSGTVFGMEALIRWQHPEKGLLAPLAFLPLLNGTELEIEISNWVIETALMQLEAWHKAGYLLEVSVNIAASHMESAEFIADVDKALARHPNLHSRYLQLEVLETSALSDIGTMTEKIRQCRDVLGVTVALDDFGTGYSSLTHLRHLTASTIKIDQSFVCGMLDDPQDYNIVDGVTAMAEAFNRQVIAEGVETDEHGLMLLMMKCENAQGYGIAKPMPAQEVEPWLEHYQPNTTWMECAEENLSRRQRALKLFRLTSTRWYQRFVSNLQLPLEKVEHWPIMNDKKCHCSNWIQRVRSQGLFDKAWLDQLEQLHFRWHAQACDLHELYMSGHDETSRAELLQLEALFAEMQAWLDTWAQQSARESARREQG